MASRKIKTGRNQRTWLSFVVSPFQQSRIGLYISGIGLFYAASFGFVLFSAVQDQYIAMTQAGTEGDWDQILNSINLKYGIIAGVLFLLFFGTSVLISMQLTHRFYGPLVSVKRFISQLSAGDFQARCIIRENDEIHDLVNDLNALAEILEQNYSKDIASPDQNKKTS